MATILVLAPVASTAQSPMDIDIPSQPLASAIKELGQETGLNVGVSRAAVADFTSPAVKGSMTPLEALELLLEDTGLTTAGVATGSVAVTQNVDPEAASDEPFLLETIIIRGELQERGLQDSGTSVTIFTGEELDKRSEPDLFNVIERTPNATIFGNDEGFSIRGIPQRSIGPGNLSPVVSIQVDGVALPRLLSSSNGPFSTWDLEQIEVLRGPQSTQQGRNALAGAIILRSNDPVFEEEYRLRFGVAERDSYEAAFVLNTPLIEDRLAFRLSGEFLGTDGFITNPTLNRDDWGLLNSSTLRGKLRWDATEDISFVLSYLDASESQGETDVDRSVFPGERINLSNYGAPSETDQGILGLRTTWQINDIWTLEAETTAYEFDRLAFSDEDEGPLPLNTSDSIRTSQVFEQDILLRFDTERLSGVIGLFYAEDEEDTSSELVADLSSLNDALPAFLPPVGFGEALFNQNGNFGTETENFAIFGEVDYRVPQIEGLTLTFGARYDRETTTALNSSNSEVDAEAYLDTLPVALRPIVEALIPILLPTDNPSSEVTETYEAFLPKFSAKYDFNENISGFFTLSRGYRAGGAGINNVTLEQFTFDPEFAWNYELAFRAELYGGDLTLNGNVYYLDWTDQQVSVEVAPGQFEIRNAGKSEAYGFELSADAAIGDNLEVFAAVGYAKTRILEFATQPELEGLSFGQPEWTAALGGTYFFDNGFSASMDVSYTGEGFAGFNPDNEDFALPDRFLVNAQIAYETGDGVRAVLYVRNLLDEQDFKTVRDRDPIFLVGAAEPRTIGAFVEYRW